MTATHASPFPSKMDATAFLRIANALKKRNDTLRDAYEAAETIHEEFHGCRRYSEYKTFEQIYYRSRSGAEVSTN